jgi:fatty-acyl-CoA synthase
LKAATVGKALPCTNLKSIDPVTGGVAPLGERGELCARGLLVMAGYYKMPEKTAEMVDGGGWLHTGDLATMNAQGFLNILGRLQDMVIRGGENLSPLYTTHGMASFYFPLCRQCLIQFINKTIHFVTK